jgi:hypothetical protein
MPLPPLAIPQLLVHRSRSGPEVVARSDGVPSEWEDEAKAMATVFGPRPTGLKCPSAVFVAGFGKKHVAVVQVTDLLPEGDDPPLGFRFLIVAKALYRYLGDLFLVSDRFPPDWSVKRSLPTLEWPAEAPPRRTVDKVRDVLQHGDGPLLLGAAQALVDGARLAWTRPAPDEAFFRGLWQLLPDSTRCELTCATFAFGNGLEFYVAALAGPADDPRILGEEQVRDYPEGRYDYNLQHAAETGNQAEIDRLFARRSSRETLRFALWAVAGAALLLLLSRFVR